jgi:zinc and cadmium transporter
MLRHMTLLTILFWVLLGSAISLACGAALLGAKKQREKVILLSLPFGAGALLGAAFFDLLPEAFHEASVDTVLLWTCLGFVMFFILERFAHGFHAHHEHDINKVHGSLIIAGTTLHNAIDGLAIGAAFLVSVPTGIIATLAIAAHEIPKEIADFGMLLGKGYRPSRVILVNILSALATVVAVFVTYFFGETITPIIGPMLGLTSGFFIYIAAADIIPDIHEQPTRKGNIQAMMLIIGIIVVATAVSMLEHSH